MGTAQEIYNKAKRNGMTLECTCVSITERKWEQLMKGSTKANQSKVNKLVRENTGDEFDFCLDFYNPYTPFKTKTHIIFVHSAIEHFFRIN